MLSYISDRARAVARRLRLIPSNDIWRFASDVSAVPASEREQSDLHRLFYNHGGLPMMKWRHYLSVYDKHLAKFRNKPVRLLEIGVLRGGSLDMWRQYFGADATIFGIDIDPACAQFNGRSGQVRIGSQDNPDFLRQVVSEMGGLDVVIDDGSHVADHQRASFNALFPMLDKHGTYICEDLHTSYWIEHRGGYRRNGTFIEFTKALLDDIHSDFHINKPGITDANRTIGGVHFYNSVVVIEKEPQERPSHFMVGR